MNLQTAINKAKKGLIKKTNSKGLYENFGQKEVGKLEDKFINISDYTKEMNCNRNLLDAFDSWCMNFELR